MAPVVPPEAFRVDRDHAVPIGTQLAWRLRSLIASGQLRPGDRLPSVREMADTAEVNVNTVRSAYGRLVAEGYLASRHGSGTFVADQAPTSDRHERLARLAADLDAAARAEGLDAHEVAAHLVAARPTATPGQFDPADAQVALRRALRLQIEQLETELSRHSAAPPTAASREAPVRPSAPRLLTASQLVAIRDELMDRLRELDAARAEQIERFHAAREAELPPSARAESPREAREGAYPALARVGLRWAGGA
jgi:DNA-binding transcriptional regulator YhcF (GntR family)